MSRNPKIFRFKEGTVRIILFVGLLASRFFVWGHVWLPNDAFAQPNEFQEIKLDYYSTDPHTQYRVKGVESHHMVPVMGLIREGKMGKVAGEIEFTLRYVPNHPEALIYAEMIGKAQDSVAYPIRYYEMAIRAFPERSYPYMQYGSFLTRNGYLALGMTHLKKAIEIEPNLALAHVWLAKAYKQQGNMEGARSEAEKAVSLGYKGDHLAEILEMKNK